MANEARFITAYPYEDDILSLPVTDLDIASDWFSTHFAMTEVERSDDPVSRVVLERDDARIGFAVNGGDASQSGAAILVTNIRGVRQELEPRGVTVSNWRVD